MYYEINESTARLSHDNMSMRDYIPNSATNEYRAAVDRAAAVLEEVKANANIPAMQRSEAIRRAADWVIEHSTIEEK